MFVVSVEGNTEALGALIPPVQSILTLTSDGSDDQSHLDLQVALMVTTEHTSEWFTAPPGTLLFGIGLVKPRLGWDTWHWRPPIPTRRRRIWLNFYDDPSDLARMVHGVGVVRDLLATTALKAFAGDEQFPGPAVVGAALEDLVRTSTPAYAHATGTCRMGPDAGTSVVDETGRVHGLDGLWVIDASIMPHIPSVPTNATTMMLAERCVAWMRGQDGRATVKPARFEYHVPSTVADVLTLLHEHGDEAKPLAGGQSLVPMLALRLTRFEHLIDLNRVVELRGIARTNGTVTVGGMTRQAVVGRDAQIATGVPLLNRATPLIGHFQIRNRGTLGGSLAHADPASEYPAVAMALQARVRGGVGEWNGGRSPRTTSSCPPGPLLSRTTSCSWRSIFPSGRAGSDSPSTRRPAVTATSPWWERRVASSSMARTG